MSTKIDGNGYFSPGIAYGQCRLVYTSSSAITLFPYLGNKLSIGPNADIYTVPDAGVTLAPTGLTAGSTYNIYAYASGANIVLEASLTARAKDTTTGIAIKTGDNTRTLVGKAYCQAGVTWDTTVGAKLVISWFNRRPVMATQNLASNVTLTSTTPVELSTQNRSYGLCWGEDIVEARMSAVLSGGTLNVVYYGNATLHASAGDTAGNNSYFQTAFAGQYGSMYSTVVAQPAETLGPTNNLVWSTQMSWLNAAGTSTFYSGATNTTSTLIIQG
jgi:hypothetical protein